MNYKTIAIKYNNWQELNKLKKKIAKKIGRNPHWDEVISDLLARSKENTQNVKNNLSKKENNLSSSPKMPLMPKSPTLPKAPTLPPLPKMPHPLQSPKKSTLKSKKYLKGKPIMPNHELHIPTAPKKKPISIEITPEEMKILASKETQDTKYILIECQICGSKPIMMPVPKKLVLEAKEPVVDVSYVHGNPKHVIVAQLDHDFQVRRRRASWVVFEEDFK